MTEAIGVLRNGTRLDEALLGSIRAVRIEQEINVPAAFSLTIALAGMTEAAQGAALDAFAPGDEVAIFIGRQRLTRIVVGRVTAIEPRLGDLSEATIRGFDQMYRLRFGEKVRVFENLADDAIAEDVARGAGVAIRVEGEAPTINAYVKQQHESDYDFLRRRAEAIDFELLVDGTTLVFRASGEGAAPVRALRYPREMTRVDLDLRVPIAGDSVVVRGFDPETNEPIEARSTGATPRDRMGGTMVGFDVADQFPDSGVEMVRQDVTNVEALQAIADARYQTALEDFISGTISLAGDPLLIAGANVSLAGLSGRFDGIYYITAATHSYDVDTGYQADLTVRRSGI
ncbi:hypothetical protein ASE86_11260 [Sphingomonas sp. Leaf33]|nr:hypothetical protein ASE86_11260 [Sphingomonas sp. Leaf33]